LVQVTKKLWIHAPKDEVEKLALSIIHMFKDSLHSQGQLGFFEASHIILGFITLINHCLDERQRRQVIADSWLIEPFRAYTNHLIEYPDVLALGYISLITMVCRMSESEQKWATKRVEQGIMDYDTDSLVESFDVLISEGYFVAGLDLIDWLHIVQQRVRHARIRSSPKSR
jgi:hypothetical protein